VNRVIQLIDPVSNTAVGSPIFESPVGVLVVTTIEITVPDFSAAIEIVDAFPGCLEPLDDSIYDTPDSNTPLYSWWYSYWGAFTQKEFLQDKVVFHGHYIYPGTYTVQYYSLVNTPGEFVLPPTLAYDLFQPEVMGLSPGGKFSTIGYQSSPIINGGTCLPWDNREIDYNKLKDYLGQGSEPVLSIDFVPFSIAPFVAIGVIGGIIVLAIVGGVLYYFVYYIPKQETALAL